MHNKSFNFHHPVAFWLGSLAIVGGVLAHLPMFVCASNMGYRMAGMEMDATMLSGMVMIPVGLALAAYGLLPRMAQARLSQRDAAFHIQFADSTGLNLEHGKLVMVLFIALAVDVLKPATLGFVMPGMSAEYAISRQTAGWLPLIALTGTTVGSILWGRLADIFGRRSAIMLSALMFIGTAICGAMPSFNWNLGMCFLMGASAGGLLPITFTLMAEMIPAAHRGWLLVALGSFGTTAGYLLAAESAAWLEPLFSWRVLWLLGLPTGGLIIMLNRFIPESPRFLINAGLQNQARSILQKYGADIQPDESSDAIPGPAPAMRTHDSLELFRGPLATITIGLIVCGVAWGLLNFGFLLWLPSNLRSLNMDGSAISRLLAHSAMLALPGIAIVIWLYHQWSSINTLILFIVFSTASLLAFYLLGTWGVRSESAIIAATAALLVSSSGVIAMLIPYAAEIYPVYLRATGSGVIAAASKFGGILGAAAGVLGMFNNMAFSAVLIAVPMFVSALMLKRSGIDTRGQNLEQIQQRIAGKVNGVMDAG